MQITKILVAFLIACHDVDKNVVGKYQEDGNFINTLISASYIRAESLTENKRKFLRTLVKINRGGIDNLGRDSIRKAIMKQNGIQGLKPNSLFTTYRRQNMQFGKTRNLPGGFFKTIAKIWSTLKILFTS